MFQGCPCPTIEQATETAAHAALAVWMFFNQCLIPCIYHFFIAVSLVQAFSPQSYPMQNPGLMSPFAFPFSPNIPPYNLSPTHHSQRNTQHNSPSPRHDTSKKKDNASKTSNVSHDKKSTKASTLAESSSSTKAHSPSVKTQSPFIPLQVCTVLSFPNYR